MKTLLKFGPADHGRRVSDEEAESARYARGYKYEVIDGRLYVSPLPNQPHDWVERFLQRKLLAYAAAHPDIINEVVGKARVFVPGAQRTTSPEPDIAAYRNFPHEKQPNVDWREVSPVLVVEVLGGEDDEKDLVRNVELYLRVPSIREYWVVDIRADAARPALLAHRRRAGRWSVKDVPFGSAYTTRLLPGLTLVIDPRGGA
jgi:Uma2 family endonuclease